MQKNVINWLNNTPQSIEFNDIYFSTDNGLEETDYVFVRGNQLHERFAAFKNQAKNTPFICLETGFGTGLNFFVVAQLWQHTAPPNAHLHFVSIEKSPLSMAEIEQTCALWPQFKPLHLAFLPHYGTLKKGENTWKISQNIRLTLHVDDVQTALPALNLQADAILLDGFAPAKNSEMWSAAVFAQLARLSQQGTTFATFTSAGHVRRGLLAAGFNVKKCAGFGKKREMLYGVFK